MPAKLLSCILLAASISSCSIAAVNSRTAYWRAETDTHLPIGATKRQAEEFFAARGVELKCCVTAPPGPTFHFTIERNVGRNFLMEYDVVVLVKISATERVESISVQRWGVGL